MDEKLEKDSEKEAVEKGGDSTKDVIRRPPAPRPMPSSILPSTNNTTTPLPITLACSISQSGSQQNPIQGQVTYAGTGTVTTTANGTQVGSAGDSVDFGPDMNTNGASLVSQDDTVYAGATGYVIATLTVGSSYVQSVPININSGHVGPLNGNPTYDSPISIHGQPASVSVGQHITLISKIYRAESSMQVVGIITLVPANAAFPTAMSIIYPVGVTEIASIVTANTVGKFLAVLTVNGISVSSQLIIVTPRKFQNLNVVQSPTPDSVTISKGEITVGDHFVIFPVINRDNYPGDIVGIVNVCPPLTLPSTLEVDFGSTFTEMAASVKAVRDGTCTIELTVDGLTLRSDPITIYPGD